MHFHHRHDVDGCVDAHTNWPDPIRAMIATLDRLESHVTSQQTTIDTAVTVLGDLVAEVASLKAAAASTVDTAALDAAVAAAQQVLAPSVPDVPAPVVDEQPPADTTVTDVPDAGDVVAPVVETPAAPVVDEAPASLGDPVQVSAAGA